METFTRSHGTDDEEDFEEWGMPELRERVELVREFDQLCDSVVAEFAWMCDHWEVVEETVMRPEKVMVAHEKEVGV